ncbi:MAG: polysaccharide biosynthesis/export family protein, partial [Gemmataceae bacterium]
GVTLSAAGLAAVLGADSARAVPPKLAAAAVQATAGAVPAAVVRLSDEVSRMMLFAKLKPAAAGVVVALAVAGFGVQTVAATATADPPAPALGPTLSDAEFLKRVCLDLRGTPATRVELGYFVADPDAAKRRKVVGWLTEPEAAKASAADLKRLAADPTRRPPLKPLAEYVIEPPDILTVSVSADGPDGRSLLKGEYIVRPDGTVGLGRYGAVKVAGLTKAEAINAITKQVAATVTPDVPVKSLSYVIGVSAFNSKKYYVISDHTGDDAAYAFPVTGSETVLDALSNIPGLPVKNGNQVWVARRGPQSEQPEQILPVDWIGISRDGITATNYQLFPGDRVYVRTSRPDGGSDAAFLTRAFREVGTLPTRIEREYFLADADPKKREKLLDLMLKDPAVAKAVGPGWKAWMLSDEKLEYPGTYTFQRGPHPLARLVDQLVAARRPADQILDTLTAAALGRLPTDAERAVILAQVAQRPDPATAWREVADALCRTPEARTHAERLKAGADVAGEKK